MGQQEISILIASIVLVVLVGIIIFLFFIFQNRKNEILLQQKEAEKRFERELAETEIEIREETLRNISWELHDNIGQLLTLAKIQLNCIRNQDESLQEVSETLSQSLTELRTLSKLINPDSIRNIRLVDAVRMEIERYNRLQYIHATAEVLGEIQPMDSKTEIIIFRIIQEFFTNTIKHSKASHLCIQMKYAVNNLQVNIKDDGIGFDQEMVSTERGIGLSNIESRGKLINSEIKITSVPKKGTELQMNYDFPTQASAVY